MRASRNENLCAEERPYTNGRDCGRTSKREGRRVGNERAITKTLAKLAQINCEWRKIYPPEVLRSEMALRIAQRGATRRTGAGRVFARALSTSSTLSEAAARPRVHTRRPGEGSIPRTR